MAATNVLIRRVPARVGRRKLASGPPRRNVLAGPGRRAYSCRSAGRSVCSTQVCTVGAVVARYYEPSTAQFLTRDPLDETTGEPYAYAADDPINGADPTGLFDYTLRFGIGTTDASPTDIMAWLLAGSNFGSVFPIPNHAPCLYAGEKMDLKVGGWVPFPVFVKSIDSNGFTFGTRPGHFDYPGFIHFWFTKSGNWLILNIHGNVNGLGEMANIFGLGLFKTDYREEAIRTWSAFQLNLDRALQANGLVDTGLPRSSL